MAVRRTPTSKLLAKNANPHRVLDGDVEARGDEISGVILELSVPCGGASFV
jgi:hypothetical protein